MNRARGECELKVGGRTYLMRPTIEAMMEFEDAAETSALEALTTYIRKRNAPMKAVLSLFHACITAAWDESGKPPTKQALGQAMMRDGFLSFLTTYHDLLTFALMSEQALKELAEAEEKEAAEAEAKRKASQSMT